jgi:hypothetical protein
MRLAHIITGWLGTGAAGNPYRSNIAGVTGWADVTGQVVADIQTAKPLYTIAALCTDAQLVTVRANPLYVVLWDTDADNPTQPPDLDVAGLTAIKAKLAAVYYQDVADLVTQSTTSPVVIESNLVAEVQLRQPWKAGIAVTVGQVYQYDGNVYEVVQAHTTQSDWLPTVAVALWKRYYSAGIPWPWVQPLGAHDAYPLGALVTHDTYTWQSTIAANVWEPGSVGAEALWTNLTPPPPTAEWKPNTLYVIGTVVTYAGLSYSCRQAHTSQIGWEPPNVLALWLPI